MKNPQVELARRVMKSLKKHWMQTNPHVKIIMNHFQEKYGELPRPDHMAIRSISGIGFGIDEANSLFSALGYRFGSYWPIPKLNIMACHFEPPIPELEKIFFSVVNFDSPEIEKLLRRLVTKGDRECLRGSIYDLCASIYNDYSGVFWLPLGEFVDFFTEPIWQYSSTKKLFASISKKCSQEMTHALSYGFAPNHFTFLMQDPNYRFAGYTTMENLKCEIENLGIPTQDGVEGDENSLLCQVSTKACPGKVLVHKEKNAEFIPIKFEWPRSYIEFIKRGADPTSHTGRYEGFLPNQAQVLFKMTSPT